MKKALASILVFFVAFGFLSLSHNPAGLTMNANTGKDFSARHGGGSDDWANKTIETRGGSFLTAGSTLSDSGILNYHSRTDAFLVLTDSSGATRWEKAYGGSGEEAFNYVALTPDGNYLAV